MLRAGAQVIVRWEDGASFMCESWEGLAIANPVMLVIAHCGTPAAQNHTHDLQKALVAELLALGATRQTAAPCGVYSPPTADGCHAMGEPDCQKLLVMVGDGVQSFPDIPGHAAWVGGRAPFGTLPLAPSTSKPQFSLLFPPWTGAFNAVFWNKTSAEAVPAVLALAGITLELPKIFISYRQRDSSALTMQIFDALAHAGFDAFLDQLRIPPGVNFQARLTEQLGDKAMVLFLESATFLDSPWVTYEVNIAKTCGLGVYALNLCGAPEIPGVDEALRMRLHPGDFTTMALDRTSELISAKLEAVVALVRREHDRAIVRRRQMLQLSLTGAVLQAGGAPPTQVGHGALEITAANGGGKRYIVALTPRPPDLPDFHQLHGQATKPAKGVVTGLTRLMEAATHRRLHWLANVSDLEFRDEGDMLTLGEAMVQGTL